MSQSKDSIEDSDIADWEFARMNVCVVGMIFQQKEGGSRALLYCIWDR